MLYYIIGNRRLKTYQIKRLKDGTFRSIKYRFGRFYRPDYYSYSVTKKQYQELQKLKRAGMTYEQLMNKIREMHW